MTDTPNTSNSFMTSDTFELAEASHAAADREVQETVAALPAPSLRTHVAPAAGPLPMRDLANQAGQAGQDMYDVVRPEGISASHALASASHLSSQANRANTPAQQPTARNEVVSLRAAAVRLDGHMIWRGADLSVMAEEFIAILGPNGAGKSTLLRLLLGLLRPSEGSVRVFGRVPSRGNSAIGYVPQRRNIDPDLPVRGRDLVQLGLDGTQWGFGLPGKARRQRRALVDEAIASVEATAYADRPIGRLSGGEQQRLLLAQALVGQPRLLLLDEPLASLDLRNQIAISQLMARLARERAITVLLVTHDVNPLLPVVDRVVYVARGQVAIGTPDEIITSEHLTHLYGAPVEVVRDRLGRVFVVGLENETAHAHGI